MRPTTKRPAAPRAPARKTDHLPRTPRLEHPSPNSAPRAHWQGVLGHLEQHAPHNKAAQAKARKMLRRLQG